MGRSFNVFRAVRPSIFAADGYTAEDFFAQTTRAGANGLAVYHRFMLLDLAFLAIHALGWLGLLACATRTRAA